MMNLYLYPGLRKEKQKQLLKEYYTTSRFIDNNKIISTVCRYFKTDFYEVTSKDRKKNIVLARQWLMYIFYNYKEFSYQKAAALVNRDHSTAIYAIRKLNDDMTIYPDVVQARDELIKLIFHD